MITKKEQKISTELLNKLLANTSVLLVQTLHYHWNIVGPEFNDYHKLFDDQYNMLFKDLDLVAERVRAVGGFALGSMKDMIKHATLKEDVGTLPKPSVMIKNLLAQYDEHIEDIRDGIVILDEDTLDVGTKKMLEDLLEQYEKVAWMLRSLTGK